MVRSLRNVRRPAKVFFTAVRFVRIVITLGSVGTLLKFERTPPYNHFFFFQMIQYSDWIRAWAKWYLPER